MRVQTMVSGKMQFGAIEICFLIIKIEWSFINVLYTVKWSFLWLLHDSFTFSPFDI